VPQVVKVKLRQAGAPSIVSNLNRNPAILTPFLTGLGLDRLGVTLSPTSLSAPLSNVLGSNPEARRKAA
jgi:hypothetical protein